MVNERTAMDFGTFRIGEVQGPLQFTRPGKEARRQAIGPVEHFSDSVRRLLDPSHFEPMVAPGPMDWLAVHQEAGQTSSEFLRSRPNFPSGTRRTIYLQPLEEFPPDGPALPKLKAFTEAFFSMEVQVLPAAPHILGKVTTRVNPETRQPQLLTTGYSPGAQAASPEQSLLPAGDYTARPVSRS